MKRFAAFFVLFLVAGGVFAISPLKDQFFAFLEAGKSEDLFVHQGPVRLTLSGNVQGTQQPSGSLGWKGIPYAQPPLGKLRWTAPIAPYPWAGVREMAERGPACYQFGALDDQREKVRGESEDCLYLDVYAPANSTSLDKLPVLIWVHGGNNVLGSAPDLGAGTLVTNANVVVVVPTFRLGGFGWFALEALRQAGEPSGNFGLLDLFMALEWVEGNITYFGGDAGNVTLAGETSGADNILALMASPLGQDLFHKVAIGNPSGRSHSPEDGESFGGGANTANEVVARLLMKDGLVSSRQGAADYMTQTPPMNLVRYLRSKSADDFISAYDRLVDTAPLTIPTVFRDGTVIAKEVSRSLYTNPDRFRVVPMIIGSNRDLAKSAMMRDRAYVTLNSFQSPIPKDLLSYEKIAHYQSQAMRLKSVDGLVSELVGGGRADIYVYRFDWDEQPILLGSDYGFLQGAAKSVEVPFLLGDFSDALGTAGIFVRDNQSGREILSETMMSYWIAFAHKGSPDRGLRGELPEWEPWQKSLGGAKLMLLDTTVDGGVRMSDKRVSKESLAREIAADKSLPTAPQKCAMAEFLNRRYLIWSAADLSDMFEGACNK